MDPAMTGEPHQEQSLHPSVFGFDTYPPQQQISWNQTNPFVNTQLVPSPSNTLFQHISIPPQPPVNLQPFQSYISSVYSNIGSNTQQCNVSTIPQGFSFGVQQPSEGVVQFPFHIAQVNHGFGHKTIRCKRKTDSPP